MLKGANTDLFNPLVPKSHNSKSQNLLFPLQIKPVKVKLKLNWRIFIFCNLGTNGLKAPRIKLRWMDWSLRGGKRRGGGERAREVRGKGFRSYRHNMELLPALGTVSFVLQAIPVSSFMSAHVCMYTCVCQCICTNVFAFVQYRHIYIHCCIHITQPNSYR